MEGFMGYVVSALVAAAVIWFFTALAREQADHNLHRNLSRLLDQAKATLDEDDMQRLRFALMELEIIADAQIATSQVTTKQGRRMLMKVSIQTIQSFIEIERMFSGQAST